jgi:ubiquinone/menaquinone biosynthesis C-methylase UbiE
VVFNVPKVLQEIKRVLKPAGEFLFLEHGKSWEKGMIAIQNISNPLFRIFGGGCNVNRDLMGDMEKSGLKNHFSAPHPLSRTEYIGILLHGLCH